MPGIKIVSPPPPTLPLATVRRDIGVDYRLAKIPSIKSVFFRSVFYFTYRADMARRLGLDRRSCRPGFRGPLCLPASPNFYRRRRNEGRATVF